MLKLKKKKKKNEEEEEDKIRGRLCLNTIILTIFVYQTSYIYRVLYAET